MRNKNYIKRILLLIAITCIAYLTYKVYRNYQRNELIKKENTNTNFTYSDFNSRFKKSTDSDIEFEFNKKLLDSISRIKDSITNQFLKSTKEKIIFSSIDKDTLTIKLDNELKLSYSSSLDKGLHDKKFNDFLVQSLESLLSKNDIKKIEVYTLTPTEYNNIPPPPGTLANFDIEKEFSVFSKKNGIDN